MVAVNTLPQDACVDEQFVSDYGTIGRLLVFLWLDWAISHRLTLPSQVAHRKSLADWYT